MMIPPVYIFGTIAASLAVLSFYTKRQRPTPHHFVNIETEPSENEMPTKPAAEPELICIYLVFKRPLNGPDLLQFIMSHHLQFHSEHKIFHAESEQDSAYFMATLSSPGTFDLEHLSKASFNGLTFFMHANQTSRDLENFDMMCEALINAKEQFGGTIKSNSRPELDLNELQLWREELHEKASA